MPSLSSMPAFRTEGVVDSCRVSMVRLALVQYGGANPAGRGGGHFQRTTRHMLNYGPVSRSADSSERTAAASRQEGG